MFDQVRSPRNFLSNIKPEDGKYLATMFNYRGGEPQEFLRAVDEHKKGEDYVSWVPDSVMSSVVNVPPSSTKASCTMVANTTALKGVFQRLATQFGAMYRRKAFIHWYKDHGMDEMEFQEADKNNRDLITEYQDKEDAVVPDDDDDEDEDDDDWR